MLTPRPGRSTLFLTALLAILAFVIPASASAATTYEVTSTGWGADKTHGDHICETTMTAEGCTLRAAIEEANEDADPDTIVFSPAEFKGEIPDAVAGLELPAITSPLTIDGDSGGTGCMTADGIQGPCGEFTVEYRGEAPSPEGIPLGLTQTADQGTSELVYRQKLNGTSTAKFKFTSTIIGSSFECKFDKGKFKKCRSPKTYKKLKPGKHVFKVRAVSPTGVADPTPAAKKFKVKSS